MQIAKILHWIVVGGIFAMPLLVFVVIDSTFFPFIFGKNIFFRIIVEVIFATWLALALIDKIYRPRINPVTVAVTTFTLIVFLADIFGINPMKSFWSNFERMEGFVTILHLYAYFLVASSMFRFEKIALWFWRFALATSFFVVLNTAIQFLTTEKNRLDSTLGNPIYLAVYALFHIFLALVLMAREGASKVERILYIGVIPLLFWVLFATATRGAILGVLGGLLLASIGIALTLRGERLVRLTAGVIVAVVLVSAGSFWIARDSNFVQNNSVLKRFANISLTEGSVFARTVNWGIAWEGVKERPFLGWGQENYSIVFNKHYDARMYAQEQWFDRVHNVILDWLIATGVLGLLAYISIFLALLWMIYKTDSFNLVQKWLIVGLFAAYSFHNLTVFDQLVSYLLFFSVVAWVGSLSLQDKSFLESIPSPRMSLVFLLPAFVIVVIVVYSVNIPAWHTNRIFIQGLQDMQLAVGVATQENDSNQANAIIEKALETLAVAGDRSTYGVQEVHEHTARRAVTLLESDWVNEKNKQAWYEAGVTGLEQEIQKAPGEARFYVFLASLHKARGNYEAEKQILEKAYVISPHRQVVVVELARNAQDRGENEEILPLLKEAYELEKSFEEVATLYAIRLVKTGDIETFDEEFSSSEYVGADSRVLTVLIQAGLHDRVRTLWEQAFLSTREARLVFLLAAVYEQLGYPEYTKNSVRRAIELQPEARVEGEKALEALNANN